MITLHLCVVPISLCSKTLKKSNVNTLFKPDKTMRKAGTVSETECDRYVDNVTGVLLQCPDTDGEK